MRIICLGDSTTYGYGVRRGEDWVSLTAKATGHELVNGGISGDTTGGMLARFQSVVLDAKPAAVLIMGGSNDVITSGTDANARSNMAAMIQQASSSGVVPIVGIPIPMDVPRMRTDWSALTDFYEADRVLFEYAGWLGRYCKIFNTPIVDFTGVFKGAQGIRLELYSDGMHPNAEGHLAMSELLCGRFKKLGLT